MFGFWARSSPCCAPSSNRAALSALGAALAALLLTSCISASPGPAQDPRSVTIGKIESLLSRRDGALDAGNVAGYLAPLSAAARETEKPLADGAARTPLEAKDLKLIRSSVTAAGSQLKDVRVDFTYRYQGLPADNEFRVPLRYEIKIIGETVQITSSRLDDGAKMPVWATSNTQTIRSEHFVAIFRPGKIASERALRVAEKARAQLIERLTFPLEPAYLVVLARNRAEYEQMTSQSSPASAIAQAETSFEVSRTRIRVRSRQIVVNLEKVFQEESSEEVFRHELGHLALAQDTRPFTPAWVSESAAMYLAETRPSDLWRAGTRNGRFAAMSFASLNRAATLGQHDTTGVTASYEYAYAAAAAWYLVEAHGADKYWQFYRSYAAVPASRLYESLPAGRIATEGEEKVLSLAEEATREGLRSTFDLDEAQLDSKVREWIRKQTRA